MASYYAVAVGNWNAATTWAATSGGAAGAGVPTNADDVFLDANSPGAVTVSAAGAVCRSLETTGFTHTLAIGNFALSIGGSTVRPDNVALKLTAGAGVTAGSNPSFGPLFVSTSATQQTITMGGSRPGVAVTINSGSYLLADTFNTGSQLNVSNASLDTGGQTLTIGGFSFTGNTTLSLGASTIHCQGTWSMSATATLNAGTSTLSLEGNSATNALGGRTYNNITMTGGSNTINSGGATCNNFTWSPGASTAPTLAFTAGTNLTITGQLTLTGTDSPTFRPLLSSSVVGSPATLTAATVTVSAVDFRDITAAGAVIPWAGTRLGDALGNSNITFDASRTLYAVESVTASYSNSAWSLSSGGATTGVKTPLPQDDVVLDAHSGSPTVTSTFTVDVTRVGRNFDTTNYVRTLTFSGGQWFFGNVTIGDNLTPNLSAQIVLAGRGNQTLYVKANTNFGNSLNVQAPGGTYTQLSDLFVGGGFFISSPAGNAGTWDANGHNVSVPLSCNLSAATAVRMGSGTWTIMYNTTGTAWSAPNGTVVCGTSTLIVGALAQGAGVTLALGTNTYNAIRLLPTAITLTGNFTAASISNPGVTAAQSITVTSGQAITLTNAAGWQLRGSAGALTTLTSAGVWTVTCAAGNVGADYLSLKNSHAGGGANFYAGANSTNVSGNTGWQFIAAPLTISRTFALTQAQNLNTQNAITRMAQQQQAAAVNDVQAISRTFKVVQGQGLSSQRAITAYVGAGQAVNVMLGSLGTRRAFWIWQVQNATVAGQPAAVIRVQAPAGVASVNIVSNNKHVDRTWTATQAQAVAVSGRQLKRRTITVTQPQALVALGRTVDSITFALGQASVVVIGFGARFFACTQRQTATVQREVRATLSVRQDQHVKVHLPIHRGHINVGGSAGQIGVVTTPDAGVAVATRAGRITVTEAV